MPTSHEAEVLARYRALVAKVDAFSAAVARRCPGRLVCAPGCSSCCAVRLKVTAIEAEAIRLALARRSRQERTRLSERAVAAPKSRCAALGQDGRCAIYETRPLACRVRGLPCALQGPDGLQPVASCEATFRDGLRELPAEYLLDTVTLWRIVGEIDAAWASASGARRQAQIPLLRLLRQAAERW